MATGGILEGLAISAVTGLATGVFTYVLSETQQIEGNRIADLASAKSNYGAALPWCWGKVRVGGNLIWTTYLEEVKKTEKTGKGAKVEQTTYSYYGYYAAMFAECPFRPLIDIPRVWMNKKLTFSKVGGAETIDEGGAFAERYLRFYYGQTNQEIDPLLQNIDPISNYSYGIPPGKSERDNFLRSIGLEPNTQILTPAYNKRAFMVAQRLPLEDFFNSLPTTEAEVVASENCTVGQILGDIFGLFYPAEMIDTSLLETSEFAVEGFFLNSVAAAKNAVQNLQKAYFFDIIQSGRGFKFIPLNSPRNVINLSSPDLAAHQSGGQKPFDYEINEVDPATLPSKVTVSYIDPDLNYDTNEQSSQLYVKQHQNDNTISLSFSIVMSASQAATIALRSLLFALIQARTYKFSLPPAYLDLEPSDLVANIFDDSGYPVRLTQTRIGANLIVEGEGVRHDVSPLAITRTLESGDVRVGVADYNVAIALTGKPLAVASGSGNQYLEGVDYTINNEGDLEVLSTGSIPQGTELIISTTATAAPSEADLGVIAAAGDTQLLVLDIPLIVDSDPDYTLYLTAGGGDNWDGASIYISTDDSRYVFASTIETYGIFGTCLDTLGQSGTVTIQVNFSELESVTDNDLALGFNLCLIGEEILQFKTASLTDTNTYVLDNLVRGLRGTEGEIPNHQSNERFVLLSGTNAEIVKIQGTATDIGQVRYFKALSSGQALDQVSPMTLTIAGNAQKPYAPKNLAATKDGVGNITLTWDRRDRRGAESENPPLSETTEEYILWILDINDSVVRSNSNYSSSYIYTSSEQINDFGSIQSTITFRIAQVSSDVGAGTYATATLTPILVEPVPTITSFTPASALVGATITLTGTNLA
nr:phage tail protein [Pleurocapsa sp. MO_192.B19]